MKSYCKGIDITDRDFLKGVLVEFFKGKTGKRKFRTMLDMGPDAVADKAAEMIAARKLNLAPPRHKVRTDPINGKTRDIWEECPMHQYLSWVAVKALEPLLEAKVCYHQCASVKGKGGAHVRRYVARWVRNPANKRYVKADIRKYYNRVDKRRLMKMLRRDVKNEPLLWLIDTLLQTHVEGLNIGSYLSQYLANYYLADAFRYVCGLKKERRGKGVKLVSHVLTYMDDWLLVGRDKRNLKMAMRMLEQYVRENLGLEFKPWKVSSIDGEPIDMVGFVFRRDRTTIRASIFVRARRAYIRAAREMRPSVHLAGRCVSYWGYFKHSDSRGVRGRMDLGSVFIDCRNILAMHQAERNAYADNAFLAAA